jgi:hypothetical protein
MFSSCETLAKAPSLPQVPVTKQRSQKLPGVQLVRGAGVVLWVDVSTCVSLPSHCHAPHRGVTGCSVGKGDRPACPLLYSPPLAATP